MGSTSLKNRLNEKIAKTPDTTNDVSENNLTQETAIVPFTSDYIALTNNALGIINENLKNQPLSFYLFDVVKSPSGGITSFSVPGLAGDNMEKELVGIILDYTTPRAFWDTQDPVEGTPPVCYSRDSIISHEGKPCNRCVYNEFGSKINGNGSESNGKACKESVHIFLLRPDNIMPIIVRVPVSSKIIFQRYMTRLIGRMIPLSGVVTRITLEKATSRDGKPYALYNFEAVNTLSPDETSMAKAFGQKFMEILTADDIGSTIVEAA